MKLSQGSVRKTSHCNSDILCQMLSVLNAFKVKFAVFGPNFETTMNLFYIFQLYKSVSCSKEGFIIRMYRPMIINWYLHPG